MGTCAGKKHIHPESVVYLCLIAILAGYHGKQRKRLPRQIESNHTLGWPQGKGLKPWHKSCWNSHSLPEVT